MSPDFKSDSDSSVDPGSDSDSESESELVVVAARSHTDNPFGHRDDGSLMYWN